MACDPSNCNGPCSRRGNQFDEAPKSPSNEYLRIQVKLDILTESVEKLFEIVGRLTDVILVLNSKTDLYGDGR